MVVAIWEFPELMNGDNVGVLQLGTAYASSINRRLFSGRSHVCMQYFHEMRFKTTSLIELLPFLKSRARASYNLVLLLSEAPRVVKSAVERKYWLVS